MVLAAFSLTIFLERNLVVKSSLARHRNLTTTYKPVAHYQRRARALNADAAAVVDKSLHGRDSGINIPAENQAIIWL